MSKARVCCVLTLALPALGLGAQTPDRRANRNPPEHAWSVFLSDPFQSERSVGVRRRVAGSLAVYVSGSFEREQREFDGPDVERTRIGLAAGLRRQFGRRHLRGLFELEGRYALDRVESRAPGLSDERRGWGAGAYGGFEFFLADAVSLGARVGGAYDFQEEPGGGKSRRLGLLRSNVSLSCHW